MPQTSLPQPQPHWVAFGDGPFIQVPAGLTREGYARWESAQCEALEPCDYDGGDADGYEPADSPTGVFAPDQFDAILQEAWARS